MSTRITAWDIGEHTIDELWAHGIAEDDIHALLDDGRLRIEKNKGDRAGSHKVIGPDRGGRLITVIAVLKSARGHTWRPITGWRSSSGEKTKWKEMYG